MPHDGPRALAQLRARIATTLRLLPAVLEQLGKGQTQVDGIAGALGQDEDEVRAALFSLEEAGLARSTRFLLTDAGSEALRS